MVIKMTLGGSSTGGAEEIRRGERRSAAKRASEVALSTCTLFGTDSFRSRIPRVRGEAGMVLCAQNKSIVPRNRASNGQVQERVRRFRTTLRFTTYVVQSPH